MPEAVTREPLQPGLRVSLLRRHKPESRNPRRSPRAWVSSGRMWTRRRIRAIGLACLAGLVLLIPTVARATPGAAATGWGRESQPIYDFSQAVHESVRVDTTMDTDGDGKRDTIAVDIVRPREAAVAGIKVPVIMDASPYFTCCGRGNESQLKTYDTAGVIQQMPLFYDNYFVPRGYASVGVDILGTGRSTGCGDMGGKNEIASVTAVIDWLNGRNTAHGLDGNQVRATWTTGAVGMIGKSYDGTLANGVAATGIRGLKTIVPISAIDSWYDYTRSNGVVYSEDYVRFLTSYVGRADGVCDNYRDQLAASDGDETGDYTPFWAERDYLRDVGKVKASVFLSHGANDLNVETKHFASWWQALGDREVPRKLWVSQEGHVDPFDFNRTAWVAQLHKWFDYWLLGVHNGVMSESAVTVERAPDSFMDESQWPAAKHSSEIAISVDGLGGQGQDLVSVTDNPGLTEEQIVATPDDQVAGRLLFNSGPLARDVRVSGTPTVTLRVRADKADTPITARLIEYGTSLRPVGEGVQNAATSSCWGASSPVVSACFSDVVKNFANSNAAVLSRGWVDAAHARSSANPTLLQPGEWRTITMPLRAQDVLVAKGHTLALAITLSDTEWTTPRPTGATVLVDLGRSMLNLPVVGGIQLAAATTPLSSTHVHGHPFGLRVADDARVPQA
jgi:X-Pro dipeptidyl-peptidase